jgi:hypothetical protein
VDGVDADECARKGESLGITHERETGFGMGKSHCPQRGEMENEIADSASADNKKTHGCRILLIVMNIKNFPYPTQSFLDLPNAAQLQ